MAVAAAKEGVCGAVGDMDEDEGWVKDDDSTYLHLSIALHSGANII
jgi:hypothetical protein